MDSIKYIERTSGEVKTEKVPSDGMLKWLYSSATGKAALHLLFKRKIISAIGGWYMNTSFSARRIEDFVNEHQIDKKEFEIEELSKYKSFNDFFYRKLKPEARKIGDHIVSPADGKILVFPTLNDVAAFFVKGSEFTLQDFLQDETLADKYKNGAMAIIRLAPPDYHRYHFPASGKASESVKINGHYLSVSPLALQKSLKIFCENKREHCTLSTADYGDVLIVDVGATMVGSIIQTYQTNTKVNKGDEKGYFAFGGSTLVLLFEEGKISFDTDLIENTNKGMETSVKMGENIATTVHE
ncbi:phosphatidylserine decarboxylase [Draconibacterium halophilum]|uniref:Phosphatidylserine decarboxylase proenzyme n=2 Tax=Draconibacterium halophilum TaxID=2706887 RepID=A0A6C0RJ28_9BACT|nr:phosphatidylserine decarboxylase [Draconibacterium halophilum]